jgi:hypothetical protein
MAIYLPMDNFTFCMTSEEYYVAPSDQVFEDVKQAAIKVWETYDDTFGYRTSKITQIKDLQNIKDNAWFMVAMFDRHNQGLLMANLEHPESVAKVVDAISYY